MILKLEGRHGVSYCDSLYWKGRHFSLGPWRLGFRLSATRMNHPYASRLKGGDASI